MPPNMTRISSLGYNPSFGPDSTVGIDLVAAVSLVVIFALLTVETGIDLSTDTNS